MPVFSSEELNMQQAVRCGIDGDIQPESFVIELDHGFIDCDVIRIRSVEAL